MNPSERYAVKRIAQVNGDRYYVFDMKKERCLPGPFLDISAAMDEAARMEFLVEAERQRRALVVKSARISR